MERTDGILQKAYRLLSKNRWGEAVSEIDRLLSTGQLDKPLYRGGALAMKAEAMEKLGDPDTAADILAEAVDLHIAASMQFAQLVLRAKIKRFYVKAHCMLGLLIQSSKGDLLSEVLGQQLIPLQRELEQHIKTHPN
jgi:hypothetical protein